MPLFIALGIALLGHDAAHPKRRALSVMALLVTGSIGCSWVLQKMTSTSVPPPLDATLCFFGCMCIASLSVSLSLVLSYVGFHARDTTSKLLWYLPLQPLRRWLYLQAPLYFGGVITLTTICPSLYWLADSLGLHPAYFCAALLVGAAGVYGLFHACHTSSTVFPAICLGITATIEVLCLQQLAHHPISWLWKILLVVIYAGKCLGWVLCNRRTKASYAPKTITHMIGQRLPPSFWYLKKLLRTSILNVGICFLLCLGITLYCWRLSLQDAEIVGTIASLIIASLVSDLRGLCRARQPAEITALRGVRYFTACYLFTSVLSCLAITPLVLLIAVLGGPPFCYLQILLGVVAGNLAGTCIVPRSRDISSQCFAVLLSALLVTTPSRLFGSLAPLLLVISEIILLTVVTFAIEYLRNPFIWRKP